MSEELEKDDVERAEELFELLQGNFPEGYKIPKKSRPILTPDQAWTVIWYLGNQYWKVPDHIERCDVCGRIYDSHGEGFTLDYGKAPYCFCDNCFHTDEFHRKNRRNPDREARKDSLP